MNELIFQEKVGIEFSAFYKQNFSKLTNFLSHLYNTDQETIQDSATDAMLTALDKIETFDENKANFTTWLYTIARRIILHRIKEKSKFISIDTQNSDGLKLKDIVVEKKNKSERKHQLNCCKSRIFQYAIPNLPKKYCEVLTLRELENYSYEEIQEELEINLNTIKSRIRQGRLLLVKKTRKKFEFLDNLDDSQLEKIYLNENKTV